jgi:F0F1-type ATP synthase assembly protein I
MKHHLIIWGLVGVAIGYLLYSTVQTWPVFSTILGSAGSGTTTA